MPAFAYIPHHATVPSADSLFAVQIRACRNSAFLVWACGVGGLPLRFPRSAREQFALASVTLSIAPESNSGIAKCAAPPASVSMRM